VLEVKITQQQERIFKREVFYFAHDFQNQIIQDDMADKSMQSIYKDLTSLNSEDKKPGILYHITKEKGNARVTIRYDLYRRTRIFPWQVHTDPHDSINKGVNTYPYILQTCPSSRKR
jgi:hypothetical protein